MMHVLLIHQAFAAIDEPGGTRHHELALYMSEKGHRVTIITSPISYLTGKSTGDVHVGADHEFIKIIRPPVYKALHRSFFHRILNFISFMVSSFWYGLGVKDIDLVWGTSPPIFQGVTAWLLARIKRVPFLFEIRDLWPSFAVAVGVLRNKALIKASMGLEMFLYRNADQLVVNSPGFIEHVTSRGAKAVALVPNGSDVQMFNPDDDGLLFRSKYGLESRYIALYAGAHGMSNDLDVVLDAAENLLDVKDLAIVLIGDGKEKPRLQKRADEMGLRNVYFLPPLPKNQIHEALASSNVCIAILKPIELYKTVYPNKVFDYMAAGKPVILAIDGVIREVIEVAEAGMAVPPGSVDFLVNAIRYYKENPQIGKIQGENGRHYLEIHFNRNILAEKMLEIMLEIIH